MSQYPSQRKTTGHSVIDVASATRAKHPAITHAPATSCWVYTCRWGALSLAKIHRSVLCGPALT